MLILAGQGTGILRLIDESRLDELASSIPAEKQGESVFGSFESRGPLLFLADEGSGRHLLPKQARFISIEDLLWKVPLLFNQLFESLRECCGSVMISGGSLSRNLYITEAESLLKFLKPAFAGTENGVFVS